MNDSSIAQRNPIDKLIIDTHVLIWYLEGIKLSEEQVSVIEDARNKHELYVSAISIWEIALLTKQNRVVLSISFNDWINRLQCIPGLNILDLSTAILIESCNLINYEHKDPADRMIIASSRDINAHLMTFDQKILDYAKLGYLKIVDNVCGE
jgi:PIN domain nuclease of toxin-antitoxin system